ncbi:hypothetical protein T439DRAFT_150876 [Meredithblackwellia eburnea MCA 4105]
MPRPQQQRLQVTARLGVKLNPPMGVKQVGFDIVHQSHHWIDLRSPESNLKFACAFALSNSINIKDIYKQTTSHFFTVLDLDRQHGGDLVERIRSSCAQLGSETAGGSVLPHNSRSKSPTAKHKKFSKFFSSLNPF